MKFIKIKSDMLEVNMVLTFPIFLYDSSRAQRIIALHANSPVNINLIETWKLVEEKGGYLQLEKDDRYKFQREVDIPSEIIDKVNERELNVVRKYAERIELYSQELEEEFVFIDELELALNTKNFNKIISRARAELLTYPLTISAEVSMMTKIVETLFVQDTFLVRMASFTYFFTKTFGIKDEKTIAQIIISILIKDIGLSLIDFNKLRGDIELSSLDIYKKHPMLSIYLLSKHPIELSKGVKRIILEQHELINGEGFPRGKTENFISINSQIVQMCDHLFKYAYGKIDGKVRDLKVVMRMIANKHQVKDLVTSYSESLLDALKIFLIEKKD